MYTKDKYKTKLIFYLTTFILESLDFYKKSTGKKCHCSRMAFKLFLPEFPVCFDNYKTSNALHRVNFW